MIDLHFWPTPNGHKITMFLEEAGLDYKIHPVNISVGDQFKADFLSFSPNNRIPAIIDRDPEGGGEPIGLFESGAILLYLAEKTAKLLPTDPIQRYEAIQWVFFQMAAVGPMFGQVGYFFKFAGKEIEDKRPLERYRAESQRLLEVLEAQLKGRQWIMGDDFTIADISLVGWVRNLIGFYGARDIVEYDRLKHVPEWLERCLARPAVQRGLDIPARPA